MESRKNHAPGRPHGVDFLLRCPPAPLPYRGRCPYADSGSRNPNATQPFHQDAVPLCAALEQWAFKYPCARTKNLSGSHLPALRQSRRPRSAVLPTHSSNQLAPPRYRFPSRMRRRKNRRLKMTGVSSMRIILSPPHSVTTTGPSLIGAAHFLYFSIGRVPPECRSRSSVPFPWQFRRGFSPFKYRAS